MILEINYKNNSKILINILFSVKTYDDRSMYTVANESISLFITE